MSFALCIENSPVASFLSCVALEPDKPGLGLGVDGSVRWQEDAPIQITIDASGRPALLLKRADLTVQITREGRELRVPAGEMVPLLHLDQLLIVEQYRAEVRIHLHGPTKVVGPPQVVSAPTEAVGSPPIGPAFVLPMALRMTPPAPTPPPPRLEPPPMMLRMNPPAPMPPPPTPMQRAKRFSPAKIALLVGVIVIALAIALVLYLYLI